MSTEQIQNVEEAATPSGGGHEWNDEIAAAYSERLSAWYERGKQLATQDNSTVWETADWLREATSFGETRERWCYKDAAAILSLSVGTCRNYASVAKAFPPERRHITSKITFGHPEVVAALPERQRVTSEVTFGHHRVVAALPEAEQERLLGAAAANGWTVGKLRSKVRNVPRKQFSQLENALTRLGRAYQIAKAWVELIEPENRQHVASYLRLMGTRLTELAGQIDALPPKATPEETNADAKKTQCV